MYYQIHHATRFRYSEPVTESVVEVRMQPRTEALQRCAHFHLATQPTARIQHYQDDLANTIHHFNIPGQHDRLTMRTSALVEMQPHPPIPVALPAEDTWAALAALRDRGELWDFRHPSARTTPTPLLHRFAAEIGAARTTDPLTLLRLITSRIYTLFDYVPNATAVDSPIDDALTDRRGVCQDFAHIFIALGRGLGIPMRYVSGYLFYQRGDDTTAPDRSTPDASHAWAEAYLPPLGWIGFDPTNNVLAAERHIRVAIGRDYDDVPPTRGVFKGGATSVLDVEVHITASGDPPPERDEPAFGGWSPTQPPSPAKATTTTLELLAMQIAQQQQ